MNAATPSAPTVLRLTGRDALDVLHRISTQQLVDLPAGAARTTLFCDFRGRLLHRAAVARSRDGAIWLVRDDASGSALLAYIDRHVFREDLTIEDHSAEWSVWAERNDAGAVEERDGVPIAIPEGRGFRLRLAPAGAAAGVPPDPEARERERIEHARPRHGHEVHEDFSPYEIGCGDEVHLSKGCYTGQEALQRLITYASVRRLPALLRGRGAPPGVPCDIIAPAGPAGRLTSAVAAGDAGGWIGLSIVKREALAAAATLAPEGGPPVESAVAFPGRGPLGRAAAG